MANANLTYEDTVDPSGCRCGPDHYSELGCSRDPERTPMQWSPDENAGFSSTNETWLPVNPNFEWINVDTEILSDRSHYSIYKKVVQLRNILPALKQGDVTALALNNVLIYWRYVIVFSTQHIFRILFRIGRLQRIFRLQ